MLLKRNEQYESDKCPTSKNYPSLQKHTKKMLETNAAVWFNKMCRFKQLKTNYIQIIFKTIVLPYVLTTVV